MDRIVGRVIYEVLDDVFKEEYDTPIFWEYFYKFVILSFELKRENRLSISLFGKYLATKNLHKSDIEKIIFIYYHLLYGLAKYSGEKIYGEEGFNI